VSRTSDPVSRSGQQVLVEEPKRARPPARLGTRKLAGPLSLLIVLVVAATLYFLYFYAGHPDRPGARWPLGWFGWFDQGQYLIEARAIKQGARNPTFYQYPFGYPFLGSLFLGVTPRDPFLIPNLVAFVATVALFFKICQRYLGSTIAVLGTALLMLATPLTNLTVIPWTTTPALIAVTFLAFVALTRERLGYLFALIVGLLLVLMYASRGGGELLFIAPLVIATVWRFRREEKLPLKLLPAAAVFIAGVGINLYWTAEIFGSPVHPYYFRELARGWRASSIPSSLWGALVYSGAQGEFWSPLLRDGFWLALAPVGITLALFRDKLRPVHLALAVGLLEALLVVAAYPAFNAAHLKFHALHYVKIWFPIAGFYSLYTLSTILAKRPANRTAPTPPAQAQSHPHPEAPG
jgi:hypothetical protein